MKKRQAYLEPFVKIESSKCIACFACVRVCPVKAIKVVNENSRPEIIDARCIGCGSCLSSCKPGAIEYWDTSGDAEKILKLKQQKKVALISPSISGEFDDITDYRKFSGMLKALGFDHVFDLGFAVDIIAKKYADLIEKFKGKYYISSYCPVTVQFVQKYQPELIQNLMPFVSPNIAAVIIAKELFGHDSKTIYIGPNIASKRKPDTLSEEKFPDIVLTFVELRNLLKKHAIDENQVEFSNFDPPACNNGVLFPLSNGILQAGNIDENAITGKVTTIEGKRKMLQAVHEFYKNIEKINLHFNVSYGDSLTGPGMTDQKNRTLKEALVKRYAQKRLKSFNKKEWEEYVKKFENLDYSMSFQNDDQRYEQPDQEKVNSILRSIRVDKGQDIDCTSCGYSNCLDFATDVAKGLTVPAMCTTFSQKNNQNYIKSLKKTNEELASMQQALKDSEIQSNKAREKMEEAHEITSSMFQKLRAGIVIVNNKLKIAQANQKFIEILGEEAEEINEIIPGLKGADIKTLVPYSFYNLFSYVLRHDEPVITKDISANEEILNVSVFTIKKGKVAGAIVRDMSIPEVQRDEAVNRINEVIENNLEMVQQIGFLLGEGAAENEKMLNSIIEYYKTGKKKTGTNT